MNSDHDLPRGRGFPIRTSADQRSLASPRGFSQRATSFIASWRQGIHRTPLSRSRTNPTPPARRTKPRRCLSAPRPPGPCSVGAGTTHASANFTHISDKSPCPVVPSLEPHGRTIHPPDPIHRLKEHARARPRPSGETCEGSQEPTQPGPHALHMEASGFEPLTPCLQSRCSTS